MSSINDEKTHNSRRDTTIDIAKTILIFLVVLGHTIQYLHGPTYDYWEDPIFKWIYGFHMPLFALISGYLFSNSIKKYTAREVVKKKAKQLLIPCATWSLIMVLIDTVLRIITKESISSLWILERYFTRVIGDLWYLKAMFLGVIATLAVKYIVKATWGYLALSCLTVFLPKQYNLHLYGYVLPFYFIGYIFGRKLRNTQNIIGNNGHVVVSITSLITYMLLLIGFHQENYIYTSGLNILYSNDGIFGQIFLNTYRFIVGCFGCFLILEISCLLDRVLKSKLAGRIAQSTTAIYIITGYVFTFVQHLDGGISSLPLFPVTADLILLCPISLVAILMSLAIEGGIKSLRLSPFLLGQPTSNK